MIDMQNAFFEAGPLHERRSDLVSRTHTLLEWARERHLLVVNVRTEHRADRSTWTLNMLEDDQGFAMEGDHKSQPLAELDLDGVTEVVKTRDDAFLGTQLEDLLRAHGIRTLVMVGVSTQSCIAATATHAYAANLHVVLAKDAIFTERPELHEDVLALLEDEYRFAAVPTDQIVDPSSVHVLTRDDPS
nr:isochorismatase family protein [Nocardioides daedukensis]